MPRFWRLAPLFALVLALSWVPVPSPAGAQQAAAPLTLWPAVPPVASYRIEVTLDPLAHTLSGREVVTYVNRTADRIPNLVWHLYLNAFRSADTLFNRESGGQLRGYGFDPAAPGWIEVQALTLHAPGSPVDLLPATAFGETLMTSTLPQPLVPGGLLTLTVEFRAQLPRAYARTGFSGDWHMVGQWYPKLGVYQEGRGWNAYPYHANGEFFADFGTYDLAITAPAGYVVAGNGLPAGTTENPDGTLTHRFHAEAVIDAVWMAGPNYRQSRRAVGPVEVVLFYPPGHEATVSRYLDAAAVALTSYGAWYGPYPYPRLTLVDVPDGAPGAGGMEYPTLVTVGTLGMGLPPAAGTDLIPEMVAIHEIGHQWWQSIVASNEAEEPWLDEGLTEYSALRVFRKVYGDRPLYAIGPARITALDLDRMQYLMAAETPMAGRAWDFDVLSYGVAAYMKPAMVLTTMEELAGEERWRQAMRTYYERYRFAHPTTADFLGVVQEVAGAEYRQLLEPLVYGRGTLNYRVTGLSCWAVGPNQRCEATVARQGGVALPVEIEVVYADGQRERQIWDGQEVTKTLVYERPAAVNSVQLDPDGRLVLDMNWLDNSLTRPVQAGPLARMLGAWLYTIEQFVLTVGGFW